jgi:four helix bundle protein
MVVRVHRLVEMIREHDPDLARQLKDSSRSTKDNIAEGCGVMGGNRRVHYLRARGSALEARGQIETAVDLGYIEPDPIADDQLDHISALMYKLTH